MWCAGIRRGPSRYIATVTRWIWCDGMEIVLETYSQSFNAGIASLMFVHWSRWLLLLPSFDVVREIILCNCHTLHQIQPFPKLYSRHFLVTGWKNVDKYTLFYSGKMKILLFLICVLLKHHNKHQDLLSVTEADGLNWKVPLWFCRSTNFVIPQ